MPFNLNQKIDQTHFTLNLIGAKQKALSTNLANINTPGYVRQDVNFEQHLGSYGKPLETDLSKKMGSVSLSDREGEVNMTEELVAMQQNALFYTIATKRVSKLIENLKTVTQLGR